jgi:predicted alpha/beta-hydrolase family hydrolase
VPTPVPHEGEALLRVGAVSVDLFQLVFCRGGAFRTELPRIMGNGIAGTGRRPRAQSFRGAGNRRPRGARALKIGTYNVNGGNGRLPRLLEWLSETNPDVVCLAQSCSRSLAGSRESRCCIPRQGKGERSCADLSRSSRRVASTPLVTMSMNDTGLQWRIAVVGAQVTAICERAPEDHGIVFVCAHGAGGHMRDRSMNALAEALRARGVHVVRFNFLYREQGSGRPDPMPRLKACMTAVIEHTRSALCPRTLVIGGRSMGGRTASLLAAEGLACDALVLFAYPLHPAGKPAKLRDAHLREIGVPVLCFNGTRDTLCRRDLMEPVVAALGTRWTMHWLEGADHSFHVLKSSGRTDADVLREVADVSARWLYRARSTMAR